MNMEQQLSICVSVVWVTGALVGLIVQLCIESFLRHWDDFRDWRRPRRKKVPPSDTQPPWHTNCRNAIVPVGDMATFNAPAFMAKHEQAGAYYSPVDKPWIKVPVTYSDRFPKGECWIK